LLSVAPRELARISGDDVGFFVLGGSTPRLQQSLPDRLVEDGLVGGASGAGDAGSRAQNAYELLERAGVLAISPWRASGSGVTLSGGSYSEVTLEIRGDGPVVCKRLAAGQTPHLDREIRQRRESAWLRQIPSDAAVLFPRVLDTVEKGPTLLTVTRFVPGYTLAELVFQRRIDGAGVAEHLIDVYEALRTRLWRHGPRAVAPQETYPQRIARRIRTIRASPYASDGAIRRLLRAETPIVNGLPCSGVSSLLRLLQDQARWSAVVHPRGRTLCHGDLILEDVLISADAPLGFALVDPNPTNQHPLYDVCKTMMSLWLGYEALYYDRFTVTEQATGRGTVDLSVRLDDEDVRRVYATAAELFLDYVEKELGDLLELPSSNWRAMLRMGAAMNMLAITVFHLLHHGKEDRALAFAATALWHAQRAIEE
jgi:hypothetical protein